MNIKPRIPPRPIRLTYTPFDGDQLAEPIIRDTKAYYVGDKVTIEVRFPEINLERDVTYLFSSPPPIWQAGEENTLHRINLIAFEGTIIVSGALTFINAEQQIYFIDVAAVWGPPMQTKRPPLTLPNRPRRATDE